MDTMLAVLFLLVPGQSPQPSSDSNRMIEAYRAVIRCPGGDIPFGLELDMSDPPRAWVINGPERIAVPGITRTGNELALDFECYDSEIHAGMDSSAPSKRRLTGVWRKRIDKDKFVEFPFHAEAGESPRFSRVPRSREAGLGASSIDGRWRVEFEKSDEPAVGIFAQDQSGTVNGTFLTTTGDYRYLEGDFADGRLRLSCFDGSHAFLFDARLQSDGTLAGDFWSRGAWHEKWSARRDPKASLPDGFRATQGVRGVSLKSLTFRGLDGKPKTLADPEFAGKVRIFEVFGSWCPNCNDESAYLVELDRRYRSRGVRIVGLAFESTGEFDRDARQVRRFLRRHGAEYPVLIAGKRDREEASKALPLIDRVRAFPTTIFLDENGDVRAVYTGFSGPATGREYDELRRQFEQTIERLLRESP